MEKCFSLIFVYVIPINEYAFEALYHCSFIKNSVLTTQDRFPTNSLTSHHVEKRVDAADFPTLLLLPLPYIHLKFIKISPPTFIVSKAKAMRKKLIYFSFVMENFNFVLVKNEKI